MAARNRKTAWVGAAALSLVIAAGCATTGSGGTSQSSLWDWTPSFLLSERERAERKLKDPASLNLAYARFQEQTGQRGEARKSYELALRADPKSVDAVLGLARLDQLADKPKEAEAGYQKALKLKPHDPRVLAACGQFYASQKRWPEAFQSLNAAIAAAPKEAIYKHELAVAKTRSGDVAGGLALFTELVGPDKAHYNVAYLLRQEGKIDGAAQECRLALAVNPNFDAAKLMLDQIQPRQLAGDPRRAQRGNVRPAGFAASSHGAFDEGDPFKAMSGQNVAASNQAVSGASQASWQAPARSASGSAAANSADATFAPAASQSGSFGRF